MYTQRLRDDELQLHADGGNETPAAGMWEAVAQPHVDSGAVQMQFQSQPPPPAPHQRRRARTHSTQAQARMQQGNNANAAAAVAAAAVASPVAGLPFPATVLAPLLHARSRWLKPAELSSLLSHARASNFHWTVRTAEGEQLSLPLLSTGPPTRPRPGAVFLYSKAQTTRWRKDGYLWIGSDRHNNLKLNGADIITCYYGKCAESSGSPSATDGASAADTGEAYLGSVGSFQRRGFCMIRDADIMLVHYLDGCLKGAAAAAAAAAAAGSANGTPIKPEQFDAAGAEGGGTRSANVSGSKAPHQPQSQQPHAPAALSIDLTQYLPYFNLATSVPLSAEGAPPFAVSVTPPKRGSSVPSAGPAPFFSINHSLQLHPSGNGYGLGEGSDGDYADHASQMQHEHQHHLRQQACARDHEAGPSQSLLSSLLLPTASARAAATTTKPFHHASNPYSPGKGPPPQLQLQLGLGLGLGLSPPSRSNSAASAAGALAASGSTPSPAGSNGSASSPLHELLAIHSPSPTRESLYASQASAPFHLQHQQQQPNHPHHPHHHQQHTQRNRLFDSSTTSAVAAAAGHGPFSPSPSSRRQLRFFPAAAASNPADQRQHHVPPPQQQAHAQNGVSHPSPSLLPVVEYAPRSDGLDGGATLLLVMGAGAARGGLFCHVVRAPPAGQTTDPAGGMPRLEHVSCVALERLGSSETFRGRVPAATHAGCNYALYVSDSHQLRLSQAGTAGAGAGGAAISVPLPFEYRSRGAAEAGAEGGRDSDAVASMSTGGGGGGGGRSRSRAQQRHSPSASRSPYPARPFRTSSGVGAAAATAATIAPATVAATTTTAQEGESQEREFIVALLRRMQHMETAVQSAASAASASASATASVSPHPCSTSLADLESCLVDSAGDDLVESLLLCSLRKMIELDARTNSALAAAAAAPGFVSSSSSAASAARSPAHTPCSSTLVQAAGERDPFGRQLVHYAAGLGYTTLLSLLLLQLHADVNSQDGQGRTPLHYAALSDAEGEDEQELCEDSGAAAGAAMGMGAATGAVTGTGAPAALMVSALLSFGADDRLADLGGSTALALADRLGRRQVVQVFLDVQSAENMGLAPEDDAPPSAPDQRGGLGATDARDAHASAAAESASGMNGMHESGASSDGDERDGDEGDDDDEGDEEMFDEHEFAAAAAAASAAEADADAALAAGASASAPSSGVATTSTGTASASASASASAGGGFLLDRAFSSLTLGDMGIGARELAAFNVPDGPDLFSSDTARFSNVVRKVQRQIRWWLFRRHAAAQKLQSVARGMLARRSIKRLRESALAIQSKFRTNRVRKEFIQLRRATLTLQNKFRERAQTTTTAVGAGHGAGAGAAAGAGDEQQQQLPHLLRPISIAIDDAPHGHDYTHGHGHSHMHGHQGEVHGRDDSATPRGSASESGVAAKRARTAPQRDDHHEEESQRGSHLLHPPPPPPPALRPGEDRPPSAEPGLLAFRFSPPPMASRLRPSHADGDGDAASALSDSSPVLSPFQPLHYDHAAADDGLLLDARGDHADASSDPHAAAAAAALDSHPASDRMVVSGAPPSRSDRDRRSSRSRSRDRDDRRSRRRSSRSRSRSRSRDSRSRSRERRRRSKKKSGWDQAPEPAAPGMMPGMMPGMGGFPSLQDPAGSMPPHSHAMQQPPQQPVVSGAIHPSRMPQLGNLPGAIPASSGAAMPYNPMQQMQQMQMQQPNLAMLPPHLAALMNPSVLGGSIGGLPIGGPSLGVGGGGAANTANLPGTRQARRLYVGGLPIPISEPELKQFFDAAMKQAFPDLPPGDSVVSIYLNLEKKFGFVEMRTPEEATTGMSLDGIVMRGMTLRIKRPSDYNPQIHGVAPSASRVVPPPHTQGYGGGASSQAFTGQISSQVPDGPNKIFAGGIPYSLGENEVKELLGSFGQLRAFHLVKERESNTSKGYCFFEYVDPNVTDTAVMGLNNLKIGDKTLTVRRAQPKVDAGQATPLSGGMGGMMGGMMGGFGALGDMGANLTPAQIGALAALRAQGGNIPGLGAAPGAGVYGAPAVQSKPATRVLVLLQMVVADILRDDEEYREILEDIESECRRYGEVRCVLIPRPSADGAHVPGMGKVFVEFGAVEHAVKARAEVEGRQFDGRTVAADYMDEGKWARRELD